jgi:hypothetical protein
MVSSCAKQGLPPGGPEDRRGPIILATDPASNSINIPASIRPWFQFDEFVDRATLEAATFISPFPEGKVKFKWRGKSVRLVFPQPLRSNMTYVITLGTGIKDFRNNPLPFAHTLAFSTGDHLDRAAISGAITDSARTKSGIQVWAYDLELQPEPNPGSTGPDYVTQTDEFGSYQLTNLRPSTYRIFAINDRRRNRRWDPNEDVIGVAFRDVITAQDSVATDANLRMTLRDTTGARITSVRVQDQHHVSIRFSKPVTSHHQEVRNPTQPSVTVEDSAAVPLPVTSLFPDPMDSLMWRLTTDSQTPGHRYFLRSNGFFDRNVNPNSTDTMAFEGSILPDTVGPHLMNYSPDNMERNIAGIPQIHLIFDEAIASDSLQASISGTDGNPLPFSWNIDGLIVVMISADSLPGSTIYAQFQLSSIHDLYGNSGFDSTLMWQFSTIPRDTLGEILGRVEDPDDMAKGPVIIEADRLDLTRENWHGARQIDNPGDFVLPWLLPGKYRLQTFRDEDQSGDYSFGYPFPFAYAERFVIFWDTVTVRSRWETAGIILTLPSRIEENLQPLPPDTLKATP